VAVVDKLVRK